MCASFHPSNLTKQFRGLKFPIVDQTPPRREFKLTDPKIGSKSLLDLQLTPSSLFYIKFTDETLNRLYFQNNFLSLLHLAKS